MPRTDRTTQIRLTRETADALRRLAADLGFLQTRGIMAGELGSVAQMFDAVARGEICAVRLQEIADLAILEPGEYGAGFNDGIAAALEVVRGAQGT